MFHEELFLLGALHDSCLRGGITRRWTGWLNVEKHGNNELKSWCAVVCDSTAISSRPKLMESILLEAVKIVDCGK